MKKLMNRRRFVKLGLITTAGVSLAGCTHFFNQGAPEEKKSPEKLPGVKPHQPAAEKPVEHGPDPGIPQREFGRTGRQVSILGLGGAFAVARSGSPEEAAAIVERSIDLGVNFIDTAPTYGASEANIGRVMLRRRQEVFLASKTIDRSYDGTMRLFEQSLKRLQTDHLDLLQLHGVHTANDLKTALRPGGAMSALEKLKDEGLINFTGITSHRNPSVLLQGINEYDFDCIMLTLNAGDPYYQPFQEDLLQAAVAKNLGIIAMKVAAYGRIFREGGITTMKDAMGYVLSFPVSTAVVGISNLAELEENASIAASFKPLAAEELHRLERLVEPYQQEVNFFKTQW